MNQFYVIMIIIGMALIVFSVILVLLDKKNNIDYFDRLESEKNEIMRVIQDSEQMLQELNKFSDYIISQVEEKSTQLSDLLSKADTQIEKNKSENMETNIQVQMKKEEVSVIQEPQVGVIEDKPIDNQDFINNKHKEVMELVEKGQSDAEIAKALKIGKGEVQLILGMNIHKLKKSI